QEDMMREPTDSPEPSRFLSPAPIQANPEALQKAAALLVKAEAPVIIADHFGRKPEAVSSLIELAELLSIPVIDKGGRFNFPNSHPLDVTGGAQGFLQKADVILALDVQDLHGALTATDKRTRKSEYSVRPGTKIIHISVNDLLIHSWANDYHYLEPVDIPITADTSVAVPELISLCRQLVKKAKGKNDLIASRFKAISEHHRKLRRTWREAADAASSSKDIATAFLATEIWETIKKEDWVLVNGSSNGWARKLWDWKKPHQNIGGSAGAGLGYGMGASIGAALAHKGTGRVCIDIQADGDFLMTPSALWTAAHPKIPLLTVIYNNRSFYNSEEHQANIAKSRSRPMENATIGTHLENPAINFAKIADGFGMYNEGPIQKPEDLRPALLRALKVVKEKKLPALLDVIAESR
ncbi:MAG: thiamine pyrophosphate-dependent enzyme, partial [Syntrophales bacterium LBB04]|nr:thiamine pyrophosphate-dependent enzyme [Syntrophales bacterium LBB04]